MSTKGDITKESIRRAAYSLFASNGFKSVTMKDICDATGLSRGGLYRHYDSTATIFEEIFRSMSDSADDLIMNSINRGEDAASILDEIIEMLRNEILDSTNSLSLSIYEYANIHGGKLFENLNTNGRTKWLTLINYGIQNGQFKQVNQEEITDTILYSYQGLRMWSRVIKMDKSTVDNVLNQIRNILI